MTTEKISAFRIVRRAYGQYVTIETLETTWTAAQLISMMMEAYNGDGEYIVRLAGDPDRLPPSAPCPVQAAWAYL